MKQTQHPIISLLILTALILSACNGILYTPPAATEHCDIDPALLEPAAGPEAETEGNTVIELWATAERQYCWRAYAPMLTAHQRPELSISVDVHNLEINEGPLTDQMAELAAIGKAPDVAYVFHDQAVRLGEAGHLVPLDSCRQRPEFAAIPEAFWTSFSADGQAWGVPMDAELILLYYNKDLLRQLGWTEPQIDDLPARIAQGQYIVDDLIATAREAIEKGVVQSGLALIPNRSQRPSIESLYAHVGGRFTLAQKSSVPHLKEQRWDRTFLESHSNEERNTLMIQQDPLEQTYSFLAALHKHQLLDTTLAVPSFNDWGNKLLLRDAASHNRLLFWQTYASGFPRMAMDYMAGSTDPKVLNDQIGVALFPASTKDRPAYARLINTGQYVIFTESASGRANQDAVCTLLAATQASGLYTQHTYKSGHPTFLANDLYLPDWIPADISPNTLIWPPPHFPKAREYGDILVEAGISVEVGDLTPSEAADVAIQRLRDTFGSQIIVE